MLHLVFIYKLVAYQNYTLKKFKSSLKKLKNSSGYSVGGGGVVE